MWLKLAADGYEPTDPFLLLLNNGLGSEEFDSLFADLDLWRAALGTPGDGNGDGKVDGLDYLLWAENFGDNPADDPPGSPANGDFDDDGKVDGIDYLVWASHFGQGSNDAVAVPEPATYLLAGCACSWERVAFARILGIADHPPNYEQGHLDDFRSEHPGGTNFVRADGSVHYIADGIDQRVYQALATRAGGDIAQETRP
ncbi:MAG: DUF1559 domain-containing protein [Pirellulales bacterium]